jgi:hypothetical protein
MTDAAGNLLAKLWRGHFSLRRSFWLFYVTGFFICWMVAGILYLPFFFLHIRTVGFIEAFLCFAFYYVVTSVGVWRSANAYPYTGAARFWVVATKGIVCIVAARILWSWANGGAANIIAHVTNGIDVGIAQ